MPKHTNPKRRKNRQRRFAHNLALVGLCVSFVGIVTTLVGRAEEKKTFARLQAAVEQPDTEPL